MTKLVDTDALGLVQRSLGLSGKGAQETEFLDGILDQTLDVGPLIRRGRTQADTGGLYTGALRNIHPGAGTLTSTMDPYDAVVGAVEPYPVPVPPEFDYWIIDAGVTRVTGGGSLTASLLLLSDSASQGWGIDDSGVAVAVNAVRPVAFWDSIVVQTIAFALQNGASPLQQIGVRLRRGDRLRFSSTANSLSTYDCVITMGLFPVAMGQDIKI